MLPKKTNLMSLLKFVANRSISDNTRLLYNILQFIEVNIIPGLPVLLLVDFEKVFESTSWKFEQLIIIYKNWYRF